MSNHRHHHRSMRRCMNWSWRSKWKEDKKRNLKENSQHVRVDMNKCGRHKNDVFMNDYKFMSYLLHHIRSVSSFSISWAATFEPSSTWCHIKFKKKLTYISLFMSFYLLCRIINLQLWTSCGRAKWEAFFHYLHNFFSTSEVSFSTLNFLKWQVFSVWYINFLSHSSYVIIITFYY